MYLAKKITEFFVSHAIISAKDQVIYEYGFELLLADFFNFSIIILIGIVFKQLWYTILYVVCFISLRSFSGGYHARTHKKCSFYTITTFLVFLSLNSWFYPKHDLLVLMLMNIGFSMNMIRFAPIKNANKPLSEKTRKANKIRAIVLFYALTILSFFLCLEGRQEGVTISVTLWIVSLGMIPAIKSQKKGG